MGRFTGKVAIVTGGGSGIGKATAQLLAREGGQVAIADVNRPAATEVADEVNRAGGNAAAVPCDISQEGEVQNLVAVTQETFGQINVLVNCAARFLMRGGKNAEAKDWHEVFSTNVTGTALCCRYAAERMRQTGDGAIVIVSSISGIIADPDYATYSASKAALLMLARSLAIDFGEWNVRVNAVSPGAVDTPALRKRLKEENLTDAQFHAIISDRQCLKMLIQPEDVARTILFLVSDDARAITGANLVVDAGFISGK
jgi:NAD(P)-dependent dehydrogenase (short-subunit alcohol dehydrogenase family)